MKKNDCKRYCDHCKKEVNYDKAVELFTISFKIPLLSGEYKLCEACAQKLIKFLGLNYKKEENDENY